MKKGRHRRFEEARALKRITEPTASNEPCVECGAKADEPCAPWCLARVPEDDELASRYDGDDETDDFDDDYDDEEDDLADEEDAPSLPGRGARP